jgi:hypothetical protein
VFCTNPLTLETIHGIYPRLMWIVGLSVCVFLNHENFRNKPQSSDFVQHGIYLRLMWICGSVSLWVCVFLMQTYNFPTTKLRFCTKGEEAFPHIYRKKDWFGWFGYCFTPTDTEAHKGRLVTLYWHQRTSWWRNRDPTTLNHQNNLVC